MKKEETRKILQGMVAEKKLDREVVEALFDNYEKINTERKIAQEKELKSLSAFWDHLDLASEYKNICNNEKL